MPTRRPLIKGATVLKPERGQGDTEAVQMDDSERTSSGTPDSPHNTPRRKPGQKFPTRQKLDRNTGGQTPR